MRSSTSESALKNSTGVMLRSCRSVSTSLSPSSFGQHAVDDRHVIGPRQCQRQPGFAFRGFIHDVSGFFQALDEISLRFKIVFDHQNAHELNS